MQVLSEMDGKLFDECSNKYKANLQTEKKNERLRKEKWDKIESLAAKNPLAKQVGLIIQVMLRTDTYVRLRLLRSAILRRCPSRNGKSRFHKQSPRRLAQRATACSDVSLCFRMTLPPSAPWRRSRIRLKTTAYQR